MPVTTIISTSLCVHNVLTRAVVRALVCVLAFLSASSVLAADVKQQKEQFRISGYFSALWWSAAQMESFDPNSPPKKETTVRLEKWEYTDPVAVPHPDSVDVVFELEALGDVAKGGLEYRISEQWKVGRLNSERSAKWERISVGDKWIPVDLKREARVVLKKEIELRSRMKKLHSRDQWPWRLRSLMELRQVGSNAPIMKHGIELPMTPGD